MFFRSLIPIILYLPPLSIVCRITQIRIIIFYSATNECYKTLNDLGDSIACPLITEEAHSIKDWEDAQSYFGTRYVSRAEDFYSETEALKYSMWEMQHTKTSCTT